MDRYTTYCTEVQTRRAIELGAPIKYIDESKITFEEKQHSVYIPSKWGYFLCPTTEQMIGWLEEQHPIKEVAIYRYETLGELNWCCDIYKEDGDYVVYCIGKHISRKEATLAAIDAALDYLEKEGVEDDSK